MIAAIRANKIRHIMKRLTDVTRVFNGEVDALSVEIDELLKEEVQNGHSNDLESHP